MDNPGYVNKAGIINEKKLFAILYPAQQIQRSKSSLTSIAQTNTSCMDRIIDEKVVTSILCSVESLKLTDIICYYIAKLQLAGALRISEVLNIAPSDISPAAHVLVHSQKGSDSKLVFDSSVSSYLLKCRALSVYPFSFYNRFYVYRQYKKHGIVFKSYLSSHYSVTHSLRHVAVLAARISNFSDNNIKRLTGHKNQKNIEYYGKNQKKEVGN